jgi:hypothetical protein
MFVIPLAFTLSTFLLWIMHGLAGTITELKQRKQRFKLRMFRRLQLILIGAVVIIGAFFVLSSLSFSDRLDEGPSIYVGKCLHTKYPYQTLLLIAGDGAGG